MAADCRAPPLLLLVLAALSAAASARLLQPGSSSGKVNLTLYYETLCPDCSEFIVNSLTELFDDGEMINIVDLKLVPYGNAKKSQDGTIICQHGEWECKLNKVEACAIDALPGVNEHFPFILCVEDLVDKYQHTEWAQCFKELEVDPEPIMDCFSGQRGDELISKYGDMTDALHPPHSEVPWVTVNDKPLGDEYLNFLKYVCEAYKGPNRPAKCSDKSLKSTPRTEGSSELKTCPRKAETP